jgi:hypothetical protein
MKSLRTSFVGLSLLAGVAAFSAQVAEAATCQANLKSGPGRALQSFYGYGYDMEQACDDAGQQCNAELRWLQSGGGYRDAYCEVVFTGPVPGPGPIPRPIPPRRQISCESIDYGYNTCYIPGYFRYVDLAYQLSDASCYRRWGVQGSYIWVDNGCRAVFEIY